MLGLTFRECTSLALELGWMLVLELLLLLLLLSRFSRVQLCATPQTEAHQAPPSLGFSRQEYWSGLPFPSPSDLPDSAIEPFFTAEPQGKPNFLINKL